MSAIGLEVRGPGRVFVIVKIAGEIVLRPSWLTSKSLKMAYASRLVSRKVLSPHFTLTARDSSASSATNAERPWHSRQNIIRAKFIFMPLLSKILKISNPAFMCITGKSYHGFIWTIHSIVILGVLLLIGTNASSCQSPSVLGFQLNQNEKHAYGTWPPGSRFQTAAAP